MGGENPDWLPADWKVSVKIRSFGRKDKYYIHPSTGRTFSSKPEVLRYLKSKKNYTPKEMNEKTVAEELPPGWIKEVRTTKIKGKTRRDSYYTDPVSGRQFRSRKEVFHYLKSKDSGEGESKPDDEGHMTSTELVDHSLSSSAEAKGQRSTANNGGTKMTSREIKDSGHAAAALENINPLVEESCKGDNSVVEKLQNKPLQANGGRRISKRLAGIKLDDETKDQHIQPGLETATENNMKIPEKNDLEQREKDSSCMEESKQHETPARQNKRKPSYKKWMNSVPRRSSKRLARLEVDHTVEAKTSDQGEALASEVDSTKNAVTSEQSDEPEFGTSAKFGGTDSDEQCRIENPTSAHQKEPHEERKSIGDVHQEDQKHENDHDSSLKILLMDPCIEFAIKTLTGAIPIEDVIKADGNLISSNQRPGCSSVSPCGDIWSDPCFEFAVKTLTSEMPAEDDGLKFQFSYEKPTNSLGGSGSSSKKAVMKQEGVQDLHFARG